jgi:hypothetical protein
MNWRNHIMAVAFCSGEATLQHRRSAGRVYAFGCRPSLSIIPRTSAATAKFGGRAFAQALIMEL